MATHFLAFAAGLLLLQGVVGVGLSGDLGLDLGLDQNCLRMLVRSLLGVRM